MQSPVKEVTGAEAAGLYRNYKGERELYRNNQHIIEERLMEEAKRKEIEAKLQQLFAQNDQMNAKNRTLPVKSTFNGARVIRRRKGKPDMLIT
jgi:hypothetical protein